MKRFLRLFGLLLILSFILNSTVYASTNAPLPELDRSHLYIQDHAQLLSDGEIQEMNQLGQRLERETGIEMLMVTMDSVDEPKRDYALRLLREYGVGKKDVNNGIVIFLNLDKAHDGSDRGVEIQIGYGLEGYFNDAKVGHIIDSNGLSEFKKGEYDQGLKKLYKAMYSYSLSSGYYVKDQVWPMSWISTVVNDLKTIHYKDWDAIESYIFPVFLFIASLGFLILGITRVKRSLTENIEQVLREELIAKESEKYHSKTTIRPGTVKFGSSDGTSDSFSSSGSSSSFGGGSGGGGGAGRDF
ncbi:TPM domain-containing protein [Staphylococcus simulans]